MKLEDQVCSLELAKRLKELGVKQESYFIWFDGKKPYVTERAWIGCRRCGAILNGIKPPRTIAEYAAFTVAELGEIMKGRGMGITAFSSLVQEEWWVRGGEWVVEKQQYSHLETEKKWSDALAKMLIYLSENKLITI